MKLNAIYSKQLRLFMKT